MERPPASPSPASKRLEADGITEADRMTRDRRGKTEVAMKVQLLVRRNLVGRAEIDDVLRSSALRKAAGIFDVSVPWGRELPIEVHAGLPGQVSLRAPGR